MKGKEKMREFLFSYRFGGLEWGVSVFADSPAEAKEKIKSMSLARYEGEAKMKIPASVIGAGLFTRIFVWWKNAQAP